MAETAVGVVVAVVVLTLLDCTIGGRVGDKGEIGEF